MLTDKQIEEMIAKGEEYALGTKPRVPEPDSDKTFQALTENFKDLLEGFARVKASAPDILEFSTEKGEQGCLYINVQFNTASGVLKNLMEITPNNEVILNGKNHSRDEYFQGRDHVVSEAILALSATTARLKLEKDPAPKKLIIRNPKKLNGNSL